MEKDGFYVKISGVFYKKIESKDLRDCDRCEAKTKCGAMSDLWNACGFLKAGHFRKLRKNEVLKNK